MTQSEYFLAELQKPTAREFMDDSTWAVKEIKEKQEEED